MDRMKEVIDTLKQKLAEIQKEQAILTDKQFMLKAEVKKIEKAIKMLNEDTANK